MACARSALLLGLVCGACARKTAGGCFDAIVEDNSPGTDQVFAARGCQGGGELLEKMKHDQARLNRDPKELRRALDESDPEEVECFAP